MNDRDMFAWLRDVDDDDLIALYRQEMAKTDFRSVYPCIHDMEDALYQFWEELDPVIFKSVEEMVRRGFRMSVTPHSLPVILYLGFTPYLHWEPPDGC